jgi:hypothetical protein
MKLYHGTNIRFQMPKIKGKTKEKTRLRKDTKKHL